jgi:hypothetical protein
MAGEDQTGSAVATSPFGMDDQRQSSVGPGFQFGRSPYPLGGQIDSESAYDVREDLDADSERRLRAEVDARRKQIVRIERPLEIGHLVAPNSESFGGYKALHDFGLADETGSFPVQFNAFQFGIFDGKIAKQMDGDQFPNGGMSNAAHEDYPNYVNLRRNIAILRNMLYVEYFGRDGYQNFVPSDVRNKEKLEKMAEMLGDALSKGRNGTAPFFNSLSIADASVPDKGVITMYNYLTKVEKKPWHRPILDALKSVFSFLPFVSNDTSYEWDIKPIEQTPLAPVFMRMDELGIEPFEDSSPNSRAGKIANLGVSLDYVRAQLEVPKMLSKPVRDEAIYLAMKILKNFRLRAGDNPKNSNLSMTPEDELQQIERIYDMALIYKDKFSQITNEFPNLRGDPVFLGANDAIAKLTYMIKLQALEEFSNEGNKNSAQIMAELMDRVPTEHKPLPGETFDVLVSRLEKGLMESAKLRGLPGPWMGMSQQAALANVQSVQQQTQIVNQKGHEDVNAAQARAATKAEIGKFNDRIDLVDAGYKNLVEGINPVAAMGQQHATGRVMGTNSRAAKTEYERTLDARAEAFKKAEIEKAAAASISSQVSK